jgi:hypothetical protein
MVEEELALVGILEDGQILVQDPEARRMPGVLLHRSCIDSKYLYIRTKRCSRESKAME